MTTKIIKCLFLAVLTLGLSSQFTFANETTEHETQTEAKFDPGSFIIDHVSDSHDWHIVTFGHEHVSIPLPIIVRKTDGSWTCFLSNKFEHGHATYEGLRLEAQGEYKGVIIEVNEANEFVAKPLDFSITKTSFAVIISVSLMLILFISIANSYKRRPGMAPKGIQSMLEPLIIFIRDEVAKPMIGKKHERFLPFLLTVFFFILINNLMGLVPFFPGGSNVTGNIAVTVVLAVATFLITNLSGNKDYWKHIFNTPGVPWWLKLPIPLMPLVEFSQVFIKPFVLMVRLFANILAGHIIALGFYSLIFIFGSMYVAA
ncbi:MAG: hypothetical protein RIS47_193, partial [Bacteroidota bacterium]